MTDKGTEVLNQKIQFGFNPGDKFGSRYQIIEEIGHGGMGKVFKAKDLELNEVVALKMIKPELSTDESIIARFKRELQLARELNHDNVIRIHDLGEIDGVKYISMKYIEGITLSDLIKTSGKLSIEKTTEITVQILSALDAAHKKGVIHRDLKPQNIMIDKKGMVILLDFGIARSIDSTNVTGTGVVLGTPDFISPEQIEGRKSSPQTDIYSFGIILYEMLTGKLPFKADSSLALMHKHLNEKPAPPSSLEPSIPKYFEHIVLKCLEKKSEDRYSDVAQIKELLIKTDIKTNKLKDPLIKKNRNEKKTEKKKNYKFLKNFLMVFVFLYLGITAMNIIVDLIYSTKLNEIKIESETYYKHRYPIEKTWIIEAKDNQSSSSWGIYNRLFREISTNKNLRQKLYSIKNNKNKFLKKQLKKTLNNYHKYLKLDELISAIKCRNLGDPNIGKTDNGEFDLYPSAFYVDLLHLQAKIKFLDGDFTKGLEMSYLNLLLNLDVFLLSKSYSYNSIVMYNLINIYSELLPVFLNDKTNINDPNITKIIKALKILLEKITIRPFFYKTYLEIPQALGEFKKEIPFFDFHALYKFFLYKDFFSVNHYIYRNAVLYKDIYQKLKYVKSFHDKTVFIRDKLEKLFNKNRLDYIDFFITPRFFLKINFARNLNKTLILIYYLRKFGFNSKEFLNLKGTEIFLNELSGNNFIITEKKYVSILFNDRYFIDLKTINYNKDQRKIINSIRNYLRNIQLSDLVIKD